MSTEMVSTIGELLSALVTWIDFVHDLQATRLKEYLLIANLKTCHRPMLLP